MRTRWSAPFALTGLLAWIAIAAAADPATQPAPHKAQVPPGFHVLAIGDRAVFCAGGDDVWVKPVLESVPAATRPATMPSDVVSALQQRRSELATQILQDLALDDRKAVDEFIDGKLLAALAKVGAMKPTVYYFPATREKIADLMDAGWTDPRFHYIRFAHDVSYAPAIRVSAEVPMDDLVLWAEIHDGDAPATRSDVLAAEIKRYEDGMANHVSMLAMNQTEHLLEGFIHEKVFDPLKLPAKLTWVDFGASNVFAVKYAALLTGLPRQMSIERLIGRPDEPRPFARIDLINALDPAQIRPEYLAAYDQALLPKGALVIHSLLAKAGDGALAKVLPVWRAHAPQTPQELIQTVQAATGVDLTPDMQPDYGLPTTPPAQPSITASKPTFVAWKDIKETYGVEKRSLPNMMEETGQRKPDAGFILQPTKPEDEIRLDSSRSYGGTSYGPGTAALILTGRTSKGVPEETFYAALGVGSTLNLDDRELCVFGIKIFGGKVTIKAEGIEFTGRIELPEAK